MVVTFALETWPAELAGVVDWEALCQALGGRHHKHAPRALTAATLIMLTLELTQPEAYARVRAWMNRALIRKRAELAEMQVAEMLRERGLTDEE